MLWLLCLNFQLLWKFYQSIWKRKKNVVPTLILSVLNIKISTFDFYKTVLLDLIILTWAFFILHFRVPVWRIFPKEGCGDIKSHMFKFKRNK